MNIQINIECTINKKEQTQTLAYKFCKVCDYKECYQREMNNNYTKLQKHKDINKSGLYMFIKKNEILYIGQSTNFLNRLRQHFLDKDTGGLRYKLQTKNISLVDLENSTLYICPRKIDSKELLYEESLLIGYFKPKYNI